MKYTIAICLGGANMVKNDEPYDEEEYFEDNEELLELELENDQISLRESAFVIGYKHKYEEKDFWDIGD
jgi:hypothetical protein